MLIDTTINLTTKTKKILQQQLNNTFCTLTKQNSQNLNYCENLKINII